MTHVVTNLATSVKRHLLPPSSLIAKTERFTSHVMGADLKGGPALRAARRKAKLTLEQLGEQLNPPVTKQTAYKYEAGLLRISLNTALQLSAILGIPAEVLSTHGARTDVTLSLASTARLPVVCVALSGSWTERKSVSNHNHQQKPALNIPVSPSEKYPPEAQYAVKVGGEGQSSELPAGSYVALVRLEAYPHDDAMRSLHEKLVHIERTRGAFIETSIRKVVATKGAVQLHAIDHDDGNPIDLPSPEVTIIGVAIGRYQPL